jgi:hypothetical protein
VNGAFALSGPQVIALALSALWIGIAILSLVVATPERISRRIVGTRTEGSFRKLASWASHAKGFWVLVVLLASGLPSEIGKVVAVHHTWLKVGFSVFPLLTAIVIFELLRLRTWAKAQPEASRPN